MSQEDAPGVETSREKFKRGVVVPTKKAMEEAMAQATSKDDAVQRIKDALPKGRSFEGPLVMYQANEVTGGRHIIAMVGTLNEQNNSIDIEVEFFE